MYHLQRASAYEARRQEYVQAVSATREQLMCDADASAIAAGLSLTAAAPQSPPAARVEQSRRSTAAHTHSRRDHGLLASSLVSGSSVLAPTPVRPHARTPSPPRVRPRSAAALPRIPGNTNSDNAALLTAAPMRAVEALIQSASSQALAPPAMPSAWRPASASMRSTASISLSASGAPGARHMHHVDDLLEQARHAQARTLVLDIERERTQELQRVQSQARLLNDETRGMVRPHQARIAASKCTHHPMRQAVVDVEICLGEGRRHAHTFVHVCVVCRVQIVNVEREARFFKPADPVPARERQQQRSRERVMATVEA
ncbi:hypothetical protein EON66_07470, partial [archaeon]